MPEQTQARGRPSLRLSTGFARGRAATWSTTDALMRTALVTMICCGIALVARRPDLLLLGLPFLIITVWSVASRPAGTPRVDARVGHHELREGETTTLHLALTAPAGTEDVAARIERRPYQDLQPASGALEETVDPSVAETTLPLSLQVRSTRWGATRIGPVTVRFLSAWNSYSYGPVETPTATLWTLPGDIAYRGRTTAPHPEGLVGAHAARRHGTGVEFSDIRAFAPGDRLRHIHWPVSLRTGSLHVTTGHAEQDAEVLLVLDALHDIGVSGGIDGDASSLDTTFRAATAVATSFLETGDRVGLEVIGTQRREHLPPASGRRQLRRILDTLARVEAGSDRTPEERSVQLRAGRSALVLMFSPVVSPVFLHWAVSLTRSGHQVIVVDTLREARPGDDALLGLAWRLRLLERDQELLTVQEQGVTVVPWHGPGSLDQVLTQARRRRVTGRRAR